MSRSIRSALFVRSMVTDWDAIDFPYLVWLPGHRSVEPGIERILDLLPRRSGSQKQGEEEPGFRAVQRSGVDQAPLEQVGLGAGETVGRAQNLPAPGARGEDDRHLPGEILQCLHRDGGDVPAAQ